MGQNADIAQQKHFPKGGVLAYMDRVLVAAEWWLRSVDHVDYLVRRSLIPVRFEDPSISTQVKELSVQQAELSSHIHQAIGQRLREQYAVERSLPSRLAKLLSEIAAREDFRAQIPLNRKALRSRAQQHPAGSPSRCG
jgi:hypothetical protein